MMVRMQKVGAYVGGGTEVVFHINTKFKVHWPVHNTRAVTSHLTKSLLITMHQAEIHSDSGSILSGH